VSFVLFKETRDNLFKNHSQSLFPQKERERFVKLSYYDYNSNYKAKVARYTELDPQQIVSVRVGERSNITNGSSVNSNGSAKSLLTVDSNPTAASSTTVNPAPMPSGGHPIPSAA